MMDNNLKMKKGATLDITQRFSPTPHVPQLTRSMVKVMHIFALFELVLVKENFIKQNWETPTILGAR